MISSQIVTTIHLIRYGVLSEVLPAAWSEPEPLTRGTRIVVQTNRGEEIGQVLKDVPPGKDQGDPGELAPILRIATDNDLAKAEQLKAQAREQFSRWTQRIVEWNLDLQLIDLEWTLDKQRLILYVLNERGPECTKLALQAAAAGLGVIDVQPVTAEGLAQTPAAKSGGGCGSCGCH